MSVLKSKRTPSKAEYCNHAYQLETATIRFCDKKSKKHKTYLEEMLVLPACRIYNLVCEANDIKIAGGLTEYHRREFKLKEALMLLKDYSRQLDIFADLYSDDGFSTYEYETLIRICSESRNLVVGVMRSDKRNADKIYHLHEETN